MPVFETPVTTSTQALAWSFNGEDWTSTNNMSCEETVTISSPADLATATNILYPGQERGGDFKAHGGIRYDNNENNFVNVYLPMDGYLWRGVRYIEEGEVQYMLDFINNCGIMYRFDHLFTLSPELMVIADELPEATESSATYNFSTPVLFKKNTLVATEIGHKVNNNVGFGFGMYDLRSTNIATSDSTWASQYAFKKETAYYGVCWLDFLNESEKNIAKSLPGGGTEGKESVYCN